MIAGAALGATVGWTGVGGALIVNGAATVYSGIAQSYNGLSNSNSLPEENPVRTRVREVSKAVGGNRGEEIGADVYDALDIATSFYSVVGG